MTDDTEELYNGIKDLDSIKDLDRYLGAIRDKYPQDFPAYINEIIREKNISPAELQKKSYIERSYFYKVLKGTKNPGRDKIISIALAAGMDLKQTQRALEITKVGVLYSKSTRDCIIIFSLIKGMSISETNLLLEHYGENLLS